MITNHDRMIFESEMDDFLPRHIIDIHSHCWVNDGPGNGVAGDPRAQSWPARVAQENPVARHLSNYELLFPGRTVTPVIFPNIPSREGVDSANEYIAREARARGVPALFLITPQTPARTIEEHLSDPIYHGVKVYLSYAPASVSRDDITIFDFLPQWQLDLLNSLGALIILHIPRDLRLRDPKNLDQMMEIDRNYPNARTIVAHVGRAYCDEDIGSAFDLLGESRNLLFDVSANTNEDVFIRLLKSIGPDRVLFGSDLPITLMRMRRVCENGVYINEVPAGLYGDLSGDPHMRELSGKDAENLTLFLYEELLALKRASHACGLGEADVEGIFHGNAERIMKDSE